VALVLAQGKSKAPRKEEAGAVAVAREEDNSENPSPASRL
jgi:hypothetical protein